MKKKVAKHLSLIDFLEEALNHLRIKWLDWNEFGEKRREFEWTGNEKTDKTQYRYQDKTTSAVYDGNFKNIHRSLVNYARIGYDNENYSRFNTRGLINCIETGIFDFSFKESKPQWQMELPDSLSSQVQVFNFLQKEN
jgi:hypothetical protein